MIRINLLGVERKQTRKAPSFDIGQRLTVACSLILVAGLLGVGYWYWTLTETSTRVDRDIAAAQAEATRLRSLLTEVQQFEARRAQLTQRVQLIEQLRGGQSVPVQLLDHVSRSLPDMLWLTSMVQNGPELTIQGRSTTLIALSDFVGNLGTNPLLIKPIEIVNSEVDTASANQQVRGGQQPVETIRFTVKAQVAGIAPKSTGRGGRGAAPARPAARK
jgi:type IV pilus assembly protein PilN